MPCTRQPQPPCCMQGCTSGPLTRVPAVWYRQHQLGMQQLPASALAVPRTPPLALHQLEPGARVILRPPGEELWVAGEVATLDPAEGRVQAVTLEVRQKTCVHSRWELLQGTCGFACDSPACVLQPGERVGSCTQGGQCR